MTHSAYRYLVTLFVGFLMAGSVCFGQEALNTLPVQDSGRIKPFDTLARESLMLVHGKHTYNGRKATDVVFTWMLIPDHWDQESFVKLNYRPLKEALKLPIEKSYFSPKELMNSDRISLLFTDLQNKRNAKQKLSAFDQAVQTLESQLGVYHQFKTGHHLRVLPPVEGDKWASVAELEEKYQPAFHAITQSFIEGLKGDAGNQALDTAVEQFVHKTRESNSEKYPGASLIRLEVFYNSLAPFQKSWIVYVLALIFLALEYFFRRAVFYKLAWGSALVAFLILILGFGLRVYIAGRPPVSNMYESVLWVAFGASLFAMIFEFIYKKRFMLVAGTLASTLCLVVADLGASVLDPSLQPLEPVLRSNFWLIIHVLTITISYAAFFLAFVLGDVGLAYYLRGADRFSAEIQFLALGCYRAIQVGVVLLAAGTILGGIWADYSWGRFWGWDPKETWAFIALMGYLALLHARLTGWVRNLGMLAGSVGSFSLVLMAWYGVNYVLGAGLHSYGFGAGGVQYVAMFVAAHLVFLTYVVFYTRTSSAT